MAAGAAECSQVVEVDEGGPEKELGASASTSHAAAADASLSEGKLLRRRACKRLRHLYSTLNAFLVILIGGVVFGALETEAELDDQLSRVTFLSKMNASLPPADFARLLEYMDVDSGEESGLAGVYVEMDTLAEGGPDALRALPREWDFSGACFFCFTAATTIGYGNYTPRTDAGKLLLVFYVIIAIPLFLRAYSDISDLGVYLLLRALNGQGSKTLQLQRAIRMFDKNGDAMIDRAELMRGLVALGYDLQDAQTRRHLQSILPQNVLSGARELQLRELKSVLRQLHDANTKLTQAVVKGQLVLVALVIFFMLAMLSTIYFARSRKAWSLTDSFYFTIVTFTTIGFGDFSPYPRPAAKALGFLFFSFLGISVTAVLVRAASDPDVDMAATMRAVLPCRRRLVLLSGVTGADAPFDSRGGWQKAKVGASGFAIAHMREIATPALVQPGGGAKIEGAPGGTVLGTL